MLAENLENWARKERQEGRQEGEEYGIRKGRQEGQAETARNLIRETTLTDEMIASAVGLDIEQVRQMRREAGQ